MDFQKMYSYKLYAINKTPEFFLFRIALLFLHFFAKKKKEKILDICILYKLYNCIKVIVFKIFKGKK